MKACLLLICICLLGKVGFAQKIKSDLEKENLKGNVDSVITESVVNYSDSSLKKPKVVVRLISKYNQNGNLISTVLYAEAASNQQPVKVSYFYDGRQRLLKKIAYYENGLVHLQSLYKYDETSSRVEIRNYDNTQKLINFIISYYNSSGNVTESAGFSADRKEIWRQRYKYDKGNTVGIEYLNPSGAILSTNTMAYDALDNMIINTEKQPDGKSTSKIYHYFNYDKKFNWLSMDETDNNGIVTQRRITYFK
ncbi:hypothetical protein [Mucilaginibacter agri]|uniref:YD repeat-containing protein n=1 Tax=Mucilaginibacter agri TaxID=2695265 RepID=A0A965ZGX4_9SPHI|nr:hypothetical protein [Mucilaginibacter agri]NCD70490.1 hypothetical protein [Mucilaginibacter agri]